MATAEVHDTKKQKKKKKIPKRFRSRMMNPNFGCKKSGWVDKETVSPEDAAEAGPLPEKHDEVCVKLVNVCNVLISDFACTGICWKERQSARIAI